MRNARTISSRSGTASCSCSSSSRRENAIGSLRHRLRITNSGIGEVTDIDVIVNGERIAKSEDVFGGEDGVSLLEPGVHHDYVLYVTSMGPPPLCAVQVRWQDATGLPGESRAELRV